jgi:very-short-patch-repair endonuclease
MAAVLACGEDAVLSHGSAAALWGLRSSRAAKIDVTVPGHRRRGQGDLKVHHARHLSPQDRTRRYNIPVTSLSRTLLDLAAIESAQRLRTLIEASERLYLFDMKTMTELIARSRGHRGLKRLKAVLAELRGPPPETRSGLERRFLEIVRAAGLPEPSNNVVVAGEVVDFHWPQYRLVVEIDSYGFHKSRRQFEEDRARDIKLNLAGQRSVRFTEQRLKRPVAVTAGELKALQSLNTAPALDR